MTLRVRRGTNAERLTVTPQEGEPVYTTDTKKFYVGDGTTVGGVEVTDAENLPTLPAGEALYKLNVDSSGNGTWVEDLLPDPTTGTTSQVVTVNTAANGYILQNPPGGGGGSTTSLFQSGIISSTFASGTISIPNGTTVTIADITLELTSQFNQDVANLFTLSTTNGQSIITFNSDGFFILGIEDLDITGTTAFPGDFPSSILRTASIVITPVTGTPEVIATATSTALSNAFTITLAGDERIIQFSQNDTLAVSLKLEASSTSSNARVALTMNTSILNKLFFYKI